MCTMNAPKKVCLIDLRFADEREDFRHMVNGRLYELTALLNDIDNKLTNWKDDPSNVITGRSIYYNKQSDLITLKRINIDMLKLIEEYELVYGKRKVYQTRPQEDSKPVDEGSDAQVVVLDKQKQ